VSTIWNTLNKYSISACDEMHPILGMDHAHISWNVIKDFYTFINDGSHIEYSGTIHVDVLLVDLSFTY